MRGVPPLILRLAASLLVLSSFGGCALVRGIAGANVDPVRLEKAREAAVLDLRVQSARALSKRLSKGPVGDADLAVHLSEGLIADAARQLVGRDGWLDADTRYTIRDVQVRLHPGAALASLSLRARNAAYDVDIALVLDCALALRMERNELVAVLEPFNIAPDVAAGGVLSGAEEIIRDIVHIRVARLREDMPPMRFPIDFRNQIALQSSHADIKGKPGLIVDSPARLVGYRVQIAEVLVFAGQAYLGFSLVDATVK